MRNTFAEVLAATIAEKGLTQKAAADEIGTDKENVNRWLGGVEPGGQWVPGLMAFLDLTFEELGALVLESKVQQAKRKADLA